MKKPLVPGFFVFAASLASSAAGGVELAGSARPLFKVSAGNNDLVMKFCPRGLLLEIR